ncbi:MAG TPA: phage major capsid protein [Acidimicrobiales bacterium]|nr:phage major capsid protein [Acidimicrobiales bacterium]
MSNLLPTLVGRVLRAGRSWHLFSDGTLLPVVSGGDGPASTLDRLRADVRANLAQRAEAETALTTATAAAEAESRDLTEDETTAFGEARQRIVTLDEERAPMEARITELVDVEARRSAAAESARRLGLPDVRVNDEPRTYADGAPTAFFSDFYRAQHLGDYSARSRLDRHMQECRVEREQRAPTSTSFGSLMVPQYLVEEFAAILRNGRAFINSIRRLPLEAQGLVFTIPRGSTGTTVAAQATQNTAVSNTDLNWNNDLIINVRSYGGFQEVPRQQLERGTPGSDRLIYADLVGDYARQLDADCIAGAGTSGTHKGVLSASGINAVTYTDATPTIPEIWPKISDGRRQVGANRKAAANLITMTTTRWGWFTAAVDVNNRPLIVDNAAVAVNVMGIQNAENMGEGQLVGTLQGLPVIVDDNIPANLGAGTNEDRIIIHRREDSIIWEEGDGMPRELRFEEPKGTQLTVQLVVYGYSAFTAERYPVAKSVISGTGLVQPTF